MATGDKGDKSQIAWGIIEEATYGVTPATGNGMILRTRGGASLKNAPEEKEMEETQPDRMSRGTSRVGNKAGGGIPTNFFITDPPLRLLIKLAMMADYYAPSPITSSAIAVSAVDNSFNGTGLFGNLKVGQMFKSSGWPDAENNGTFRVAVGSTANKVIVKYGALKTVTAGTAATLTPSKMIRNGVTRRSASLCKWSMDIAGRYFGFPGQCVDSMNLEVNAQDFLKADFNLVGRGSSRGASQVLPGTLVPATNMKGLDASNHVKGYRLDDLLYVPWTKFTVQFQNQLAAQIIGGTLQPDGYSLGKIDCKLTMEAYYVEGDPAFDDAFDGDEGSFAMQVIGDSGADAGKEMWVTCPKYKYTGDPTPDSGDQGGAMITPTGTAFYDPDTQCVLQFDFFD